jgi:hypothetical protein
MKQAFNFAECVQILKLNRMQQGRLLSVLQLLKPQLGKPNSLWLESSGSFLLLIPEFGRLSSSAQLEF